MLDDGIPDIDDYETDVDKLLLLWASLLKKKIEVEQANDGPFDGPLQVIWGDIRYTPDVDLQNDLQFEVLHEIDRRLTNVQAALSEKGITVRDDRGKDDNQA